MGSRGRTFPARSAVCGNLCAYRPYRVGQNLPVQRAAAAIRPPLCGLDRPIGWTKVVAMMIGMVSESEEAEGAPRPVIVGVWLLLCALMVFAVAVLGGVTRLEHAGLSIPSWEPLAGILPPLTAEVWAEEFAYYRQFPEYQMVHQGLDLAGFQYISWFEYTHRLLARAIGVVFALPLLFFWLTHRIEGAFAAKLVVVLVLGGLQGVLGWYMVSSGLVDRPDVSHYRLTAHLGLAVILYATLLWFAFSVFVTPPGEWGVRVSVGFRLATYFGVALVYILILSGGLVAGLDAGFVYNTFPKMGGQWIPPGLLPPNPLDSIVSVQFLHRWGGVVVAAYLIFLWGRSLDVRVPPDVRGIYRWLLIVIAIQGGLGITTLLMAVPVPLGAIHQAGALVVLAVMIGAAYAATHARVRPEAGIHILP